MADNIERDANTDDFIDEFDNEVTVAGITWRASRVLFELDPIAYREIQAELESMEEEDD